MGSAFRSWRSEQLQTATRYTEVLTPSLSSFFTQSEWGSEGGRRGGGGGGSRDWCGGEAPRTGRAGEEWSGEDGRWRCLLDLLSLSLCVCVCVCVCASWLGFHRITET
ncbi:hypothetical protein ATANTOWER_009610 [Ataeniobius toweri]|uniref:Uncharacterized protein n=1 Tax=Ataeniobius toweri TaxID=208326 RepID=A0ABU7CFL8_9TELE|nr:hypothetical protein [Ataeniobius toweri]